MCVCVRGKEREAFFYSWSLHNCDSHWSVPVCVCRPNITVMDDWALKINDLCVCANPCHYLSCIHPLKKEKQKGDE